jgi:cytochrome P450
MTDEQVRDEAMTIFLAGHETTAVALAWTWYLLSSAPDVEARLHEELDRVLKGRRPTVADLPSLPYVEQVVTESMRLYPPAWIIGRRALEDYRFNEYPVPKRSIVILRLDGARARPQHDRPALEAAPGRGPPGRPAAGHYAEDETRTQDDPYE